MSGPGGRGFLDRWSARKRDARQAEAEAEAPGAPAATPQAPLEVEPAAAAEPDEAITEEELARLTPVEQASSSLDLRPYLRRGVPEALRRAALRRMWMLNPAIRDYVDPALDYAWDFTAPSGASTFAARVASLSGTLLRQEAMPAPTGEPVPSAMGEPVEPHSPPPPPSPSPTPADVVADVAESQAALDAPAAEQRPAQDGADPPEARPRRRHGGAVPRIVS